MNYAEVSIVVIGYNEQTNLENTFNSILDQRYPKNMVEIIYVDSGSTDRSIEIAEKYADKVVIEEKYPSPGRNRNRGLVESRYEIVHFLDGDVMIDPNYLANIVSLFKEKNVSAIVGQLDEQNPNFYNRLSQLANNENIEGYIDFTSTGGTYLKQALLDVEGYDERILRGEETDLGTRFREEGNKIWCTSSRLGSHNYDVNNLGKYIRKYKVDAEICVKNSLLMYDTKYLGTFKRVFRNNCFKLVMYFLSVIISVLIQNALPLVLCYIFDYLTKFRRHIKDFIFTGNKMILVELGISLIIIPLYYYGFIKELVSYFFNKDTKEYYKLRKMKLSERSK